MPKRGTSAKIASPIMVAYAKFDQIHELHNVNLTVHPLLDFRTAKSVSARDRRRTRAARRFGPGASHPGLRSVPGFAFRATR